MSAALRFPRRSGILLHPTSLPGPHGSGDLGAAAFHFVDWLEAGAQRLWQVLPLGGIGPGNSPYMSASAFAGNVLLIDLHELAQRGWLAEDDLLPSPDFNDRYIAFAAVVPWRIERLARAAQRFAAAASAEERADLRAFGAAQRDWLADYALFMAIAEQHRGADWCDWPAPLAAREPAALAVAAARHAERIHFHTFCQWCFCRQWQRLRRYANERGIQIVGDVPIFVAHHSADVWTRRELFELDASGRPAVIAGVPPDAFSATGQRWGNPLYRWSAHAADGYAWWLARLRHTFDAVDLVRIDHFRGFAAHWEIPASEPTAINGRWVPGPGKALFDVVAARLGTLAIIAEDLGVITPDVDALRRSFGFPGMRVLQFAWGDAASGANPYLPHNHTPDSVVYTGTHDNDTTLAWWAEAGDDVRRHVRDYLGCEGNSVNRDFIRAACASVADSAIIAMPDVLDLGPGHRMNFPGTASGNWSWRFAWTDVEPRTAARLRQLATLYGRI